MRRLKLPLTLLGIHSCLVILVAFADPNWNDMSPSFALLMALYFADYPIHAALGMPEVSGRYLMLLLFAGGAMWFATGFAVSAIVRSFLGVEKIMASTADHNQT